ncbi:MAG: hypothetical protein EXR05_09175 [Acetobacteraceae bacterium]|nr:hypothetical protein [Acetobacteraceae bacterium]
MSSGTRINGWIFFVGTRINGECEIIGNIFCNPTGTAVDPTSQQTANDLTLRNATITYDPEPDSLDDDYENLAGWGRTKP